MQFEVILERGTTNVVFIGRRQQKEYHAKERMFMCFVDIATAFDRAQTKMLKWAMMKKGIHKFCLDQ